MPKVKKIPQRQCVGCREMRDKRELLRVVKSPEGGVSLDFKGKKPGRGAYVCHSPDCLKKARKSRALERALSVRIPPEVYDAMQAEMDALPQGGLQAESAAQSGSLQTPSAARSKGGL